MMSLSDEEIEEMTAEMVDKQPLEGVLYDLNLLPEFLSAKDKEESIDRLRMEAVKHLKQENQSLRESLKECRDALIQITSQDDGVAVSSIRDFAKRKLKEMDEKLDNQLGSDKDE